MRDGPRRLNPPCGAGILARHAYDIHPDLPGDRTRIHRGGWTDVPRRAAASWQCRRRTARLRMVRHAVRLRDRRRDRVRAPDRAIWCRAPVVSRADLLYCGRSCSAAPCMARRPAPATVRFGLPAMLLVLMSGAASLMRMTGSSAPLAMSMPTMSQPAPALSYFDTDGKLHALADLKGKVVLLNFWATWCTPCRREMPMLSKLQNVHARRRASSCCMCRSKIHRCWPIPAHPSLRGNSGTVGGRRAVLRRRQVLSPQLSDQPRWPRGKTLERPPDRIMDYSVIREELEPAG